MEGLAKIILKLEYILEADSRTIRNPECENSEMFDMAYKLLKIAKSLEKVVKGEIKTFHQMVRNKKGEIKCLLSFTRMDIKNIHMKKMI